jgi:hypothetical protein
MRVAALLDVFQQWYCSAAVWCQSFRVSQTYESRLERESRYECIMPIINR